MCAQREQCSRLRRELVRMKPGNSRICTCDGMKLDLACGPGDPQQNYRSGRVYYCILNARGVSYIQRAAGSILGIDTHCDSFTQSTFSDPHFPISSCIGLEGTGSPHAADALGASDGTHTRSSNAACPLPWRIVHDKLCKGDAYIRARLRIVSTGRRMHDAHVE